MKRLLLFALLALVCGGGAFAQTPPGAYSSPSTGGSAFGTPPASPNGVPQLACETPVGGVAGPGTYCRPGVGVNTQTLGTPYTVLVSDLGGVIKATNSGAGTITIPDGGTAPFTSPSNFGVFAAGTGDVTLSRTSTSTICAGAAACANTQPVYSGQFAYVYLDALNNWQVSVILSTNPGTNQTITGQTTTGIPLTIVSAASTANYALRVLDNASNPIMRVDPESAAATSYYGAGGSNGIVNLGNTGSQTFWRLDPNVSLSTTIGGIKALNYQTSTNCAANGTAANPSVVSCGSATAGMFSCATNASTGTCQINTTSVTANSEIQIIQDAADGGASQLNVTCNTALVTPSAKPILLSKSAGANFIINLGTVTTNPGCFEYTITN